ncbi:MAG: pilin [Patescibacteria group bacterium]
MKKLAKNLIALCLSVLMLLPVLSQAETFNFATDTGLASTSDKAGFSQEKKSPENIVQPIITAVLSLIGVLFLGLAIFGGIKWMTAKGNEKQVNEAQMIITNAIIGLVVVAAAYAITYFVLKSIASQTFKGV